MGCDDKKVWWILPRLPAALVLASCAAAAGCIGSKSRNGGLESAALSAGAKGPNVSQVGSVAAGAKISVADTVASFVAPGGSTVALAAQMPANAGEKLVAVSSNVLTLSGSTPFKVETHTQTAEGPKSFPPPAQPTPADVATGAGIRVFYWVAAGLAVVSVVCFYMSHAKAGFVAAVGAGALPLLASFSSFAASHATVGIVAIVFALVAAWYFVRGKIGMNNTTPNTP